jgi:hypothetical protein
MSACHGEDVRSNIRLRRWTIGGVLTSFSSNMACVRFVPSRSRGWGIELKGVDEVGGEGMLDGRTLKEGMILAERLVSDRDDS